MELTLTQFTFRLLLILVLAGLLGLEREMHSKSAGLRTNILVGLGSTLYALIALGLVDVFDQLTIDPSRVVAQVVTGIGFLGAGAVIQSRGEIHGLTTAATIWLVAGIGLAVAFGFYWQSLIVTLVALVVLFVLGLIERRVENKAD